MNRINLSLLCAFFGTLFSSFAQVNDKNKPYENKTYFITGVGGSYVNVIDEGISPLLYKGVGGGAVLGHYRETAKSITQSTARFDFNNPISSISGAEMYTYRLEGMYQHFFKTKNQEGNSIKIYPGAAFLGRWVLRDHLSFTNNSQHIETRFSLAPSVLLQLPFSLFKRKFETGIFSQIPIITYATRPIFASTKFSASLNKENADFFDYLKDGEISSFGDYFRWSAQSYLLFHLNSGNAIRLDYFWMYENYNSINPVTTGEHSIMISTFLKL